MNLDGWTSPLLVESQPDNPWSRKIYAFRNHFLRDYRQGNRCIMLTSCWPGEGKSSLAANLAASLTQMAFRVALVDTDLKKPTLSAVLGQRNTPGVAQVLKGEEAEPVRLVRHNFDLLPAGLADSAGRSDVKRSAVLALFGGLKRRYDCVVVDSTALSLNSDALSFGAGVDGCMMVVRGQRFQGLAEGHRAEDLREAGISILGILLNG